MPDGTHTYGVVCLYEGGNESAVEECSVGHYAGVDGLSGDAGAVVRVNDRTVYVESAEDAMVRVFNLSGQLVAGRPVENGYAAVRIDVSGVYVVKVEKKENSVIKKVVIY